MGEREVADECLVGMGYATGVRGVLRRFRAHAAALQELSLRWQPDPPPPATPTAESAAHPYGSFLLELGGPDKGRLMYVWPGWGRRFLGAGRPEDLRSQALRIVRQGGPFGGPTIARTGEHIVQVREPQGGMRHPLPDGSELRTLVLGPQTLGVRVWPDGKVAQLPITGSLDALSKLIEDDAEHLSVDSQRAPWVFTNLHPLIGMIRMESYDVLLCALRVDLAGIFVTRDDALLGIRVGPWDRVRATLVESKTFAPRSPSSDAKAEAAAQDAPTAGQESAEPSTNKDAAKETPTADKKAAEPPAAKPTAGKRSANPSAAEPSADKVTDEAPAPKRRKRAAASPGGMPGRRERRVRLKAPLAAAVTHHLAGVASQLPVGVLGAAFAVELLRALEAAALSDHPTATGKALDLFSRLHKKGFLATIPGDQAGRAALKLLAERTPLVRKIHYRRWCFAFGDIHDAKSALHARLGPLLGE